MKNTIKKQDEVIDFLFEFGRRIRIHNNLDRFDVNTLSEGFCAKLLNIVHFKEDYNLINLNLVQHNYKALDLGDVNKQVAYQVTSQNNLSKIKSTIDKFAETDDFKNKVYTDLRFIILNDINWSSAQRREIKRKFNEHGLPSVVARQVETLETIEKGTKLLDEQHFNQFHELLKNEFSEEEPAKANIDVKVFEKLNEILDEDEVSNIYEGLYSGSPYYCAELGDEFINPYISQASKVTGQFVDDELQNTHELFLKSLNKLHLFVLANYTSHYQMEHLVVPEYATGFEKLLARDALIERLNVILEQMLKNYRDYRKLVRTKLQI